MITMIRRRTVGVSAVFVRAGLVAALLSIPVSIGAAEPINETDAHAIGVQAYVYLYSLVTMDITRKQLTNVERPDGLQAPMNVFANVPVYPTADTKVVVRPNFDTLYSSAWLDLTKEPMIVSVPDTGGRYYLLPMLDMWTDVFASPGWRTTGTQAGSWAIVPPGWTGALPDSVKRIDAPDRRSRRLRCGPQDSGGLSDHAAIALGQAGRTHHRED
jgi:hypothetical protein